MKAMKLSVLAIVAIMSSTAMANVDTRGIFSTITNPVAISAEVGTTGAGGSIAWAVNDTTELQAGWTGAKINQQNIKIDNDISVGLNVNANNPYLGVQMRPAANWLTIGAGVIVPKNNISGRVSGRISGSSNTPEEYKFGNDTYTIQNANVSATYKQSNKLAPYITVGLRPTINNNWGVFADVGAFYPGKTDFNVAVNGTISKNGKTATDAEKRQLEDQIEQKIENKFSKLPVYPIVKVGATYRF